MFLHLGTLQSTLHQKMLSRIPDLVVVALLTLRLIRILIMVHLQFHLLDLFRLRILIIMVISPYMK